MFPDARAARDCREAPRGDRDPRGARGRASPVRRARRAWARRTDRRGRSGRRCAGTARRYRRRPRLADRSARRHRQFRGRHGAVRHHDRPGRARRAAGRMDTRPGQWPVVPCGARRRCELRRRASRRARNGQCPRGGRAGNPVPVAGPQRAGPCPCRATLRSRADPALCGGELSADRLWPQRRRAISAHPPLGSCGRRALRHRGRRRRSSLGSSPLSRRLGLPGRAWRGDAGTLGCGRDDPARRWRRAGRTRGHRSVPTTRALVLAPVVTALMVFAGPAGAQLASPVASEQGNGTAERSPAATQTAIPPPREGTTFQPAVIDNTPPDPADDTAPAKPSESNVDRHGAPPSEFESFVSEAAGTTVRRFGADLLMPGARDFSMSPTTAVPDDYRLNPGDQVQLGLSGSVQASNLRLTIGSEGRIFVPRVGGIAIAGVRLGDLHDVIARRITRQYRGFDLQVTISRLRGITVSVTGFANKPGSSSVSSLSTLVNAVLAAGGPPTGGRQRTLPHRRGGRLGSFFDLYDLLLKCDMSGEAVLQIGDLIFFAPAGAQVAVVGAVYRQ